MLRNLRLSPVSMARYAFRCEPTFHACAIYKKIYLIDVVFQTECFSLAFSR